MDLPPRFFETSFSPYHHHLPSYETIVRDRTSIKDESVFQSRFFTSAWNVMKAVTVGSDVISKLEPVYDEDGNVYRYERKRSRRDVDSIQRKYLERNMLNLNLLEALITLLPLAIIHDIVVYAMFDTMFPDPVRNLYATVSINIACVDVVDRLCGSFNHDWLKQRVWQMFCRPDRTFNDQSVLLPAMGFACVARRSRHGKYPVIAPVGTFPFLKQTHLSQNEAVIGNNFAHRCKYNVTPQSRRHREIVAWMLLFGWIHSHAYKRGFCDLVRLSMVNKDFAHAIMLVVSKQNNMRRSPTTLIANEDDRICRFSILASLFQHTTVRVLPDWKQLILLRGHWQHAADPGFNDYSDEEENERELATMIEEVRSAFFRARYQPTYHTLTTEGYVINPE